MTLHVFNPEHDIALAYDNKYFTAPHAGRQLRNDLDYLPVLWAAEGERHAAEQNSRFPQVHSHLPLPTEQVGNLNHCEAAYLRAEP